MIPEIIPLGVLFIPYGLFLIIFGILALFHFYHVFRFGFGDKKLFIGTFLYICAAVLILYFTAKLLAPIDFNAPLVDLRGSFNRNPFFP